MNKKVVLRTWANEEVVNLEFREVPEEWQQHEGSYDEKIPFSVGGNQELLDIEGEEAFWENEVANFVSEITLCPVEGEDGILLKRASCGETFFEFEEGEKTIWYMSSSEFPDKTQSHVDRIIQHLKAKNKPIVWGGLFPSEFKCLQKHIQDKEEFTIDEDDRDDK